MRGTFLILCLWTAIDAFSQTNALAKGTFTKISVTEKITEQMVTESKESIWVFTEKSISYLIGGKEARRGEYLVLRYKYDDENYYVFYCKDEKSQIEYAIQYKDISPRHVFVQKLDGTAGFFCHN